MFRIYFRLISVKHSRMREVIYQLNNNSLSNICNEIVKEIEIYISKSKRKIVLPYVWVSRTYWKKVNRRKSEEREERAFHIFYKANMNIVKKPQPTNTLRL